MIWDWEYVLELTSLWINCSCDCGTVYTCNYFLDNENINFPHQVDYESCTQCCQEVHLFTFGIVIFLLAIIGNSSSLFTLLTFSAHAFVGFSSPHSYCCAGTGAILFWIAPHNIWSTSRKRKSSDSGSLLFSLLTMTYFIPSLKDYH